MIRILEERIIAEGLRYIDGACVSGDTKPTTGIVTGSRLTEADTGDVYMFAEGDTPAWNVIQAGPAAEG